MQAGSNIVYTLVASVSVTQTSSHRSAMLALYSGETQYTGLMMRYVVDLGEVSRIICMIVHRSQRKPDSNVHITWSTEARVHTWRIITYCLEQSSGKTCHAI
jgi:hypothetical protein